MRDLLMTVFGPGVVCPVCGLGPGEDPMDAWFVGAADYRLKEARLFTRCERCKASFSVEINDDNSDLIHQPVRAKVAGVMKTVVQWRVKNGDEEKDAGQSRP